MDRNTTIGLLLVGAILIGYSIWTRPSEADMRKAQEFAQKQQDSLVQVEKARKEQETQALKQKNISTSDSTAGADSLKKAQLNNKFGNFADAGAGKEQFLTLENNLIKVKLSNKGGRVYSVTLKEFKRYDSTQIVLFDGQKNIFGFQFASQNKTIHTNELFFTPTSTETKVEVKNDKKSIALRLNAGEGHYIEYVYSLEPNSYQVNYKINFVGMNQIIEGTNRYLDLQWESFIPRQEKGKDWENNNTAIYYRHLGDNVDNLSETAEKKSERIPTKLKWIGYKQQFFSSVLIADSSFEQASLSSSTLKDSINYLKHFVTNVSIPYNNNANESHGFTFYFGPNKYTTLKGIQKEKDLQLQKLVPLGWGIFGIVNRFCIIPLFNFLGLFISNFGLVILLMTIIIKLVLFPLTYKSYLSTASMKALRPQIDELNKRIPADKAMERQQATMALYKKAGVNPMGGCLPMLLQMPILIAMFRFFPASIELRQKAFLWASDLSTYDSILNLPFTIPFYGNHVSLFCLLMAGSMVLSTKYGSSDFGGGADNPQMQSMKMMTYIMPVMMLVWFNSYSSGLSFYYFVSNIISFSQMMIIRRYVDDEALLKKIQENSNKKKNEPVKKSNFQQRLEDMAKKRGYNPPKK